MKLTREENLGHGLQAQLFDTGEILFRKAETGQTTWLPKESVDTLIDIVAQIKAEQKETN
jgi:hypothetical protein